MKKIYAIAFCIIANYIFAQETISFESSEGFTLGNLHNQNGWQVTDSDGTPINNQLISNELAFDGEYALKNGFDDAYGFQWFPIFGATKTFDTPYDFTDGFSISYKVYPTEGNKSNFEFTGFGIKDDEYVAVFGLAFDNNGTAYVYTTEDYRSTRISNFSWTPKKWYSVRVEIDPETIKYWVDDSLIFTGENFSKTQIVGLNMVHDNFGGDAYYDLIKINEEKLSTSDTKTAVFKLYPNPVEKEFLIDLPNQEQIKSITIYELSGKKILETTQKKVFVQQLSKGVYLIKIETEKRKSYSKKFIKK